MSFMNNWLNTQWISYCFPECHLNYSASTTPLTLTSSAETSRLNTLAFTSTSYIANKTTTTTTTNRCSVSPNAKGRCYKLSCRKPTLGLSFSTNTTLSRSGITPTRTILWTSLSSLSSRIISLLTSSCSIVNRISIYLSFRIQPIYLLVSLLSKGQKSHGKDWKYWKPNNNSKIMFLCYVLIKQLNKTNKIWLLVVRMGFLLFWCILTKLYKK